MYDVESLSAINQRFINAHWRIVDSDVHMANWFVQQIQRSRTDLFPISGDIVRYTDEYGNYWGHGHIESIYPDGAINLCTAPYHPHAFIDDDGVVHYTTSGGPWTTLGSGLVKYAGKAAKRFWSWGHCGATGDGGIEFDAEVNVWEYEEPGNIFAPFTTKHWDRYYIQKLAKPTEFGDRYLGSGRAFATEREFFTWLLTYHGVVFKTNEDKWGESYMVFTLKKRCEYVSQEEWDALPFPTDTRMCNASIIPIKYNVDEEAGVIYEYRYTNHVDHSDGVEYRVAAAQIADGQYSPIIYDKTLE